MHYLSADGRAMPLELVAEQRIPAPEQLRRETAVDPVGPVARAARAHFEATSPAREHALPPLPLFRDPASGLLRTVYKEVVLRFRPGTPQRARATVLRARGLAVVRSSPWVGDQVVVRGKAAVGADLLDVANELAAMDEVDYAHPNFVSEYRRSAAAPVIPDAQWHLDNRAVADGQVAGEDVGIRGAWRITRGSPDVVVAVLDDGVDIEHANLRRSIARNPDADDPDRVGRDFFVPETNPDHFNPRPKRFALPYDELDRNDIHGTPCAGVVAAAGRDAWGAAPRCRLLPVKIFHAREMAADERVADAIRYAATRASVLSCSWVGPQSPDIAAAVADAGRLARGGLGAPVVCATGNSNPPAPVGFPARAEHTIAVGASTDRARIARYSNRGAEVDLVAPSSGGSLGVYTTDLSAPGMGYVPDPPPSGLHTATFGGTSSATPLVAAVAALMLSISPGLTRDDVRDILVATAHKIGDGYGADGHSPAYGFGRVDAAAAVRAARDRR